MLSYGSTYLYSNHFDSRRVPPLPFPAFYTHGTEAQQADRTVSLAHLDAVNDARSRTFIRIV